MENNASTEEQSAKNDTLLFMSLPEEYKAVLIRHYGPQPEPGKNNFSAHPIQSIQSLTEREKCILDGQYMVSPFFSIQIIYKVKGEIQQSRFDQAAQAIFARNPMLRSNYCKLGKEMARIVFDARMPDITYRNMSQMSASTLNSSLHKIMTEEKRHPFNPVSGSLVRFYVINTGKNESAVIVTQSILTALNWNAHELIAITTGTPVLSPENMAGVYISEQEPALSRVVLAYWKNLLKDLPPMPDVPGRKPSAKGYEPAEYELKIAARDFKALMERSNGNKNMLMTLLQTTWGLLLQYVSGSQDTYYSILLPDNCARLRNATATTGVINPMIIRLKCNNSETMKDIAGQQFRQIITSQSYPCTRIKDLYRELGFLKITELFTHFLSFHTLSMQTMTYAKSESSPDGRVSDMHSWEPSLYDLGVYFHLDDQGLRIIFVYNHSNFVFYGIERLAKYYEIVLHSFMANWENRFEDFESSLHEHLAGIRGNKLDANIKQQKRIDFFSQLELFEELPKQDLKTLAASAQMKIYFENDKIPRVDQEDALLFIVDGNVARSIDDSSNFTPLDIRRENSCINEHILVSSTAFRLSLQIVSERAHILSLPISAVRINDTLMKKMQDHALKAIDRFQQSTGKQEPETEQE